MPHHRLPAIAARGALVLLILAGVAADALAQKVITQASALNGNVTPGDLPGFPVTISQPGTFVLGSDLVLADANTMGIEIFGRNVTLDLGGFSIKGPGGVGTGTGIRSTFAAADVAGATVIRNGTVSGVGSNGIDLDGTGSRIDRITVANTGGDGIVVGPASIVTNSRAANNNGTGILAWEGSLVENNVAASNLRGIVVDTGSTVLSNTAVDNRFEGFMVHASGWGKNVASNNNGGNGNPQFVGAGIALSGANLCGGVICP